MSYKDKILDYSYKHETLLMAIAIFLALVSISFRFGSGNLAWTWAHYPGIAAILMAVSILILLLSIRGIKREMDRRISDIQSNQVRDSKIKNLSKRQAEVLHLIMEGKSNKEICQILFIELSTLKTHINQIYKILGIKSRKEALRL